MTFRLRLITTYLILFVAIIFALSVYLFRSQTSRDEQRVILALSDNASHYLDSIDDLYDRLLAAMVSLDKVRAWTDGSPVDYVNDRLRQYCAAFGGFDRMTLYDEAGVIVADSGGGDIGMQDPIPAWKEGIAGRFGYLMGQDRTGSAAMFIYRRVASRDGRQFRVIIGRVPFGVFSGMAHGFKSYESQDNSDFAVKLVARDGMLLHASERVKWGGAAEWNGLKKIADNLWSKGRLFGVISDRSQVSIIALPDRKPGRHSYPWVLIVDAPKSALFAASKAALQEMALFALLLGCCSSLVIWLLAKRLSRPVEELARHAVILGKGDFSALRELDRRTDEFGLLVDSFKQMGERLQTTLSELTASQEMYRSVIETTPDAITVATIEGAILMANQHSLEIFGNNSIDEVVGRNIFEWVSPEDREMAYALMARVVAGEMVTGVEIDLLRRDETFIGEVSAIRVTLEGDYEDRLIIVTADITDRKRSEHQILKLNEELEQLVARRTEELNRTNKELAGFCYAISHELRAPVARLQGFSRVLREDCSEEADRHFCSERIEVASRQLQTVIDAILMLSRLSRLEMNITTIDLTAMARDIVAGLQLEDNWRSHRISIQDGMFCQGDPDLMSVCLQNLLGNAVKYSSKVVDPQVTFGMEPSEGEKLFHVRDNGAGFDMAFSDKLFVPFQRLHLQDEFPGTGIGLATVHRIVERHGGKIWAEGKEGEGATFFFTIGTGSKD